MMGSEEEEDWFSDAREEVSDYNSQVELEKEEEEEFVQASGDLDLWTMNPDSVSNRRNKFFQSMGFSFKKKAADLHIDPDDVTIPVSQPLNSVSETDYDHEEKLLRNESISSSQSDTSSSVSSSVSTPSCRYRGAGGGPFLDRAKHIDDRIFLTRDCSSNSNSSSSIALSGSSSSRSADFHSSSRYDDDYSPKKGGGGGATGWLKKLGVLTHVLDKNEDSGESHGSSSTTRRRQLTRVQSFKKHFKELSSLCIGQEFSAHDGSIVVMKFSHDGSYLATAGEDCVVRVWTITEEERSDNMFDVAAESDSTVYFGMNDDKSQIEPLNVENEKVDKSRSLLLRKKSESTCAVLPSKVFTISETPQHEFQGHAGEILDLSWSDKGFLLSSSVDETVRLWRVGSSDDECLRVFSHKSFVTCVAFNPVDENYFISGSTDGKVRIWDVSRVRVVDYTDIKEIVTALCYRPDAKGVVVGSMAGDCLFYHTIDNQLELDKEISLHGGKKKNKKTKNIPSKRITGFQFFPGGSDKLMVTSADSQIRIISGVDTICKLKKASSLRTTLSPTSAMFTSDGKHIVSTIEDSGIHVWDYSKPNKKASSPHKPKTIRSYEGFLSDNVSVAIPWLGQQGKEEEDIVCSFIADLDKKFAHLPLPVRDCFSQLKGATTWPEEKLGVVAGSAAAAISATASTRSKLRLLRSVCQNVNSTCTPHLWGLVIVTATWDGRIRVFHNYGLPIRV